jgi:hypothetical protein
MSNHAYVVMASTAGATELHVVVATDEEDAGEIILRRAWARDGEHVTVCAQLRDETADKIGADLTQHGIHAMFFPRFDLHGGCGH